MTLELLTLVPKWQDGFPPPQKSREKVALVLQFLTQQLLDLAYHASLTVSSALAAA